MALYLEPAGNRPLGELLGRPAVSGDASDWHHLQASKQAAFKQVAIKHLTLEPTCEPVDAGRPALCRARRPDHSGLVLLRHHRHDKRSVDACAIVASADLRGKAQGRRTSRGPNHHAALVAAIIHDDGRVVRQATNLMPELSILGVGGVWGVALLGILQEQTRGQESR